jgi:GDP-mannose 6-dehydrogenase
MRISVFGLGYVGCVSAACLSDDGHNVIGVDNNPAKVAAMNSGQSPIVEPNLEQLIARGRSRALLEASSDAAAAVAMTDMSFVCIQTPSAANGSLDLSYVLRVAKEIGETLKAKSGFHVVVFRSTMLPHTMERQVIPTLERAAGKRAGVDFGVAYHPEFLREGSAISDYRHPPKTVVGALDERSALTVAGLYASIDAPLITCELRMAEMVKYADNAFHALKVAFANEVGAICGANDIDSHALMEVFCQDRKLNISPVYLRPGFAFGGSCLPKDLRALSYLARSLDLAVPVLDGVIESNLKHKQRALQMITALGKKRIGFLGLSFKDGTDDLRESPTVELVEQLVGKGYQLQIFDPDVNLSRLTGANKAYIDRELPHIASLLISDPGALTSFSEVLVATKRAPIYAQIIDSAREGRTIIDLVRITKQHDNRTGSYHGLVG